MEFIVGSHEYFEREGDDIYLEVPLTLTEAILGCKKEIPTLYGNVKLTVAAGTNSGDRQRIKNQQAVIEGIMNKVLTSDTILNKYTTLLKSLSSSLILGFC